MFSPSTKALLSARPALDADTHRQHIDARIAQLHDEIRALNSCRNTRSSAVGLPTELLSHIFLIVRQDHEDVEETSRRQGSYANLRWLWISHVCSHWRRVALGCAALWTKVAFVNPILADLMLSRTQNAPLTVELVISGKDTSQIQDTLLRALSQTNRLRSIRITRQLGGLFDLLPTLRVCSGAAPILQSVHIEDFKILADFEIPSQFLAGGAPSLTSLEFHLCRVSSWSALPLGPNLTSLKLSVYSHGINLARPSWRELSASLDTMPLLHTLHLSHYLPHCGWQLSQHQLGQGIPFPIALERLSNLKLSDTSTEAVLNFLQLILHRHTSEIELTFHRVSTLDFLPTLFARLRASQCIETYGAAQELHIEGPNYFETTTRLKFHSAGRPDKNLSLSFRTPDLAIGQILGGVQEEVDWSSLSRVSAEVEAIHEETWTLMFASLTSLSHISLQDSAVDGFSAALKAANSRDGFPALAHLTLEGINFKTERYPLSLGIIPVLNGRPKSTPPLTLHIGGALNCTEDQIDSLYAQLPKVEVLWDGYYEEFRGDTTTDDESSNSGSE